jgi:hypothetical protein
MMISPDTGAAAKVGVIVLPDTATAVAAAGAASPGLFFIVLPVPLVFLFTVFLQCISLLNTEEGLNAIA